MLWSALTILLSIFALFMVARHGLHVMELLETLRIKRATKDELDASLMSCVKFNELVYTFSPQAKLYADKTSNEFLRSAFRFFIANKDFGNSATRVAEMVHSIFSRRHKTNFKNVKNAEREIRAFGWIVSLLTFVLVYGGVAPVAFRPAIITLAVAIFAYGIFFSHYFVEPILARHEDEVQRLTHLRDMVELTLVSCESGRSPDQLQDGLHSLATHKHSPKLSVA